MFQLSGTCPYCGDSLETIISKKISRDITHFGGAQKEISKKNVEMIFSRLPR